MGNVVVCIFQRKEILTRNPPLFIAVLAGDCVFEQLNNFWVDVVVIDVIPSANLNGAVSYRTTATEEVVKVSSRGQLAYHPFRDAIL